MLLSSTPLRSSVGDGTLQPLSLSLRSGAPGEVRPQNPVTQVRIATDPMEGFTIGPDPQHLVTIVPLGLRADAPNGTAFAGQMLFAGARDATDLLLRPSATGVQTFEQLNSEQAPQAFFYRLQLAPGQSADLADGVVTIRQAGSVIVRSLPPVAVDADRRPVPVTISLTDNVVRLDVAHRDGGFRYPIAVDPDWTSSYNYHDQPGLGRQGWYVRGQIPDGDPPGAYYNAFINNEWDGDEAHRDILGFFIKPIGTPSGRVFPRTVGARIGFDAPGSTHIRSVTFNDVIRVNDRDRQTLRFALYGANDFKENDDIFEAEQPSFDSHTLPSVPFPAGQDTPAKSVVMWMFTSPCDEGVDLNCPPVIDSDTSATLLKVGSVQLVLTDFDFPTTQAAGTLRDLQDRWTNATDTRTLDPSASDEGSGIRDLGITVEDADGTHTVQSIQSPCRPDHDQTGQGSAICPQHLTFDAPFSLDTGGLLEGRSTFTVDASDLADNTATAGGSAAAFSLYLDRSSPSSTVNGELYDAAGAWTRPRAPSQLTVAGADTAGGEGRTSGIAHNLLSAVDARGTTVLDRDADTCTPPGPIAAPCDPGKASAFTVDSRQLPEGPIAFSARSRDLAGNDSDPVKWTVRLDRTPPAARAAGDLLALTSQHTNSTTATTVTLQGRDAGSGVARLQLVSSNSDGTTILADRDTCAAGDVDLADGACPHNPSVTVTVDPGALPDGPTTFIARAIDQAGIWSVDNQDWDTYVDHTPPDSPDSVTVAQTSSTSVQITWPTVVDRPLGSGGVSYEYLVTAGGQSIGTWRPTSNAYAQAGGLPPGTTIAVLVRAIDAAHNVGIPTSGSSTLTHFAFGASTAPTPSRVAYQPHFLFATDDYFWPVRVQAALNQRWDGRVTCYEVRNRCEARGAEAVLARMRPNVGHSDVDNLDLPPPLGSTSDQFTAAAIALGIDYVDYIPSRPVTQPFWREVEATSRLYFYPGGGRAGGPYSYQYWAFMPYNYLPSVAGRVGRHEADWEGVAIIFGSDNRPKYIYETRHGGLPKPGGKGGEGAVYHWTDERVTRSGSHFLAYAARGSHAMYYRCGRHNRAGARPSDNLTCEPRQLLRFTERTTPLIRLAKRSWACWKGRFGQGAGLPDSGAPVSPLHQQGDFSTDRNPCAGIAASRAARTRVSSTAATAPSEPEQLVPDATADAVEAAGSDLVSKIDECSDWDQEPTQPGLIVVACSQDALSRFVASDLTAQQTGGPSISGPSGGGDGLQPPAVYNAPDTSLRGVQITGGDEPLRLRIAGLDEQGARIAATLPNVELPPNATATLRLDAGRVLVRSGRRTIAGGRVRRSTGTAKPLILEARRIGSGKVRLTLALDAGRTSRVAIGARRTRTGRSRRLRTTVLRPGRNVRVIVSLRPGERWISVVRLGLYRPPPATLARVTR